MFNLSGSIGENGDAKMTEINIILDPPLRYEIQIDLNFHENRRPIAWLRFRVVRVPIAHFPTSFPKSAHLRRTTSSDMLPPCCMNRWKSVEAFTFAFRHSIF